jgi:hypothetical protein
LPDTRNVVLVTSVVVFARATSPDCAPCTGRVPAKLTDVVPGRYGPPSPVFGDDSVTVSVWPVDRVPDEVIVIGT